MLNIFIGAGASVDFGMPLVNSFTDIFRTNILKRLDTNLFNFYENFAIKAKFQKQIERDDINYEEIIKNLEIWMLSETGEDFQIVAGLVSQTVECVHLLLQEIQIKSFHKMVERFQECNGLLDLVNKHKLVNIFSLNHDVMMEELCNFYHINFKDGFRKNISHNYNLIGKFKVATQLEFTEHELDFLTSNDSGINLFKLHGALDFFAIEDKKKYLKVDSSSFGGCLTSMVKIERHSLNYCRRLKTKRGVNELIIEDDMGEMQFLRRSLLSGGHKFKKIFEQIAPIGLLEEFKFRIQDSQELVIIGYGFGDEHVNEVIFNYLNSGKELKVIICDPFRNNAPSFIERFNSKIEIRKIGLIDFLKSYL